uniref:Mitotic spindle assembly checkpoint protein MAD1 n=1 Tax=Pygocentrus nattereri TaxID=42514 RepID=A0AAR2JIN3_PYGNA
MEEAAERIRSHTSLLQLTQEKQQMELSHKRARIELEKEAHSSSRDLQRQVDQNQDLLTKIRHLEEKEEKLSQALSEQLDNNKALKRSLEELKKQANEKDNKLGEGNQMISELKDEVQTLNQKLQIQESKFSTQNLENQALQEQLEMQRKKYQEVNQKYQSLQSSQLSSTESELKIKELKRRLVLQEQDSIIVKNMKTEVARLPELEREVKRLQEDNLYLRETKENCSLLKEETEGLRKKLERMEKVVEEKLKLETLLHKYCKNYEVLKLLMKLAFRRTKPKKARAQLQSEATELRSKALEEQKKRENQDALVRRLQKRVLLLTKERDGMRAILESYDSELAASEYSPQLTRRVKEAEEMLQKVQAHNTEMETFCIILIILSLSGYPRWELAEHTLQKMNPPLRSIALKFNVVIVCLGRQKIEELESERQRLEEQNNILEMRLERHNLQGDYDPVKTKVVHFRLNPTQVAKQQRAEELEQLRAECERLRDRLRKMEAGGAITTDDTTLIIPPSQEILDLRKQMERAELKNQRLKEVFQKKIQEFRTVCYVLTGYQIDITVENQYRLTSVYAERMEDSLLFKASGPVGSGNMQLLETDFSRTLTELVDLHLFHQKSIPVFLSAITLDLFSRQTVV